MSQERKDGDEHRLNEVKSILISTLNDRKKEIGVTRSFYQSVSLNSSSEVVKRARELFVKEKGDIDIVACFFQMSDNKVVFDHSASLVIGGHLEGVRGFNVEFEKGGLKFDCYIFDPAGSREFYDRKNEADKELFLANHVARLRRGYVHKLENPNHLPFYTAFINLNEENGAYTIEKIAFIG